jgi:uncharacterized membrane protein
MQGMNKYMASFMAKTFTGFVIVIIVVIISIIIPATKGGV